MRFLRGVNDGSARIVLALVLLALFLDFLFFTGFFSSDDIGYLTGARALAGEGTFEPELGNTRLGITLPSALVYKLTGNVAAVAWFHCLYHLVLVVLTYVLGRLLHGERTGLIGAALVATSPLLYGFAGAVLPDNATAMWLAASMIAMTLVLQRYPSTTPEDARLTSWNPRRARGFVIAGALLGVSYLCKESALIMAIPAAIYIMAAAPRLRDLIWIQNGAFLALGLLLVVVLDFVVLRLIAGEWVSRMGMVVGAEDDFVTYMAQQGETPFERFGFVFGRLETWMPATRWVLPIGAFAYAFLRTRSLALVAYFWWPLIFLTIGSTSLTEYLPPTMQPRYYAIVIVPGALMTAAFASMLVDRWRSASWTPVWSRGRAPIAALVFAMAVLGWGELRAAQPVAGMIFRAPDAKAFLAALEVARDHYGKYPVVISSAYRRRMAPLLFKKPEIDARLKLEKGQPVPPYLEIIPTPFVDDTLKALPSGDEGRMLERVYPPANRTEVLLDAVRRLVGVSPRPVMPTSGTKRRAATLVLVTRKSGSETTDK